ncbi:hypothetical protein PAXRUDRAFT_798128, partial [Paxillus rubicundulus Ve08.2h10]
MFWSDATHLAQFGQAKAWPIYLFFGNLSKYLRGSPSLGACHPIAFIPDLPDTIKKFISNLYPKKKNHHDILAHCKRELVHAIWTILLDDDFIEAYKNGIVIKCYDGVKRRVFPRIFTYSADYPENKVVAARDVIYKLGSPIKGTAVEHLLKEFSLVPTINAFVDRLSPLGFDLFPALVVDLLHEFELGILKSVLKHLTRILFSIDPSQVWTLNDRFYNIPPFGTDGIRRFPENAADMKHRVARHFEDMLQCSIPAFEGLFPAEHDDIIRVLLFRLAEWHALAKLRLHTDGSLQLLDHALKALAAQLRKFERITCNAFQTRELPSETAARRRRQEMNVTSSRIQDPGARPKTFNLLTYKFHALGDYVNTIKMFGTTDSYTMQIGESAHRLIKKFYGST